jgi:anaerobic ribonucleoside-triphosphate reductase activating protein
MMLNVAQVAFGLCAGVLGATPHRMGVWTQGCSLRKCPGCTSAHTWSPTLGRRLAVASLIELARRHTIRPAGLTVSGGEPTDQAEAVAALVQTFRVEFPGTEAVLYTGLRWPTLVSRYPGFAQLFDVAITGPYVRTLPATPLAGSSNQEVRLLTPLAERLYRDWDRWPVHAVQVAARSDARVVAVGIPHTARMERAANAAGLHAGSWLPTTAAGQGE